MVTTSGWGVRQQENETREVASQQGTSSGAMGGFGKSEATIPPQNSSLLLAKVGFLTFPVVPGLAGQVTFSHILRQRMRPLTLVV